MNGDVSKFRVKSLNAWPIPGTRAVLVLLALAAAQGCANLRQGNWNLLASSPAADVRQIARTQSALAVQQAEAAEQQGQIDQAIRYYAQAQQLDPEQSHLSRRLAVLYDQSGDSQRARAAYEQALALEPENADLLNDYGVYHLHREQWTDAESWFRRALENEPQHQRATNNLAMSLAMQNRLDESFDAFSQVVGPAAANSNLGVLLARQGQHDLARDYFQRALTLDRSVRLAAEFLSRLDRASPGDSAAPAAAHATVRTTARPAKLPTARQVVDPNIEPDRAATDAHDAGNVEGSNEGDGDDADSAPAGN